METQNQDVAHSPAEVPNDPGKMFIGGLSWQTSPGKSPKDTETSSSLRFNAGFRLRVITMLDACFIWQNVFPRGFKLLNRILANKTVG